MALFIVNELYYPRYIGDLKNAHPDWIEGDALPNGWEEVDETFEYLENKEGFAIIEKIEKKDGKWKKIFVYELIDENIKNNTLKNEYRKIKQNNPEHWKKYFSIQNDALIQEINDEEVDNGGDNL